MPMKRVLLGRAPLMGPYMRRQGMHYYCAAQTVPLERMRRMICAHMMRQWCCTGRSIHPGSSLWVSLDVHSQCFDLAYSDDAADPCSL